MLPLITLNFRINFSTPCDDACDYYNRYEFDAFLNGEDDQETLVAKGSSVLYLMEKASDDGFDIIDAFDDNHHEIPNIHGVANNDMYFARVNAYYRILFSFYDNNFIAVEIIDRRRGYYYNNAVSTIIWRQWQAPVAS